MKKVVNYICGIGTDKYVHLLACLLITFVVGQGIYLFSDYPLANCAAMGGIAAMMLGVAKECYDEFSGGDMDYKDLFFDAIGCLLGILVTAF